MSNPFMPGVATSFAQAGRDTLEQALKQRLLEQQMQQSQLQMLAQIDQRDQMNAFRMDSAMRADESLRHRQSQDAMTRERQARLDGEKAAETAGKKREATNRRGAADMYFEGLTRGINPDDPGMLRSMSEGDVRVSMRPKEPKPTLADKVKEAEALTEARERTKSKFAKPKATKVALVPPAVRTELEMMQGKPGYKTAAEALLTIKKKWPQLRKAYGDIDMGALVKMTENLYGEDPTPSMYRTDAEKPADSGSSFFTPTEREQFKQKAMQSLNSF